MQLIIAGKAHPLDVPGKELLRDVVQESQRPRLRERIVFLEDYDMHVARYLVQGADVWLNVPRRPLEASGTSGMKAAVNGGLNLSVLDGWWAEGYAPETAAGPIGSGEQYEDPEENDAVEAEALYTLLEREVIPAFYSRDSSGRPARVDHDDDRRRSATPAAASAPGGWCASTPSAPTCRPTARRSGSPRAGARPRSSSPAGATG